MSNGLVNNSNSYVSDPVLSLFTILQLDTSRRRMRFPQAFISASETAELDLIIVIVIPHKFKNHLKNVNNWFEISFLFVCCIRVIRFRHCQ